LRILNAGGRYIREDANHQPDCQKRDPDGQEEIVEIADEAEILFSSRLTRNACSR